MKLFLGRTDYAPRADCSAYAQASPSGPAGVTLRAPGSGSFPARRQARHRCYTRHTAGQHISDAL
jgi:hypothetical protein